MNDMNIKVLKVQYLVLMFRLLGYVIYVSNSQSHLVLVSSLVPFFQKFNQASFVHLSRSRYSLKLNKCVLFEEYILASDFSLLVKKLSDLPHLQVTLLISPYLKTFQRFAIFREVRYLQQM